MNYKEIDKVFYDIEEDVSWDNVDRKTQVNLELVKKHIKKLRRDRLKLLNLLVEQAKGLPNNEKYTKEYFEGLL